MCIYTYIAGYTSAGIPQNENGYNTFISFLTQHTPPRMRPLFLLNANICQTLHQTLASFISRLPRYVLIACRAVPTLCRTLKLPFTFVCFHWSLLFKTAERYEISSAEPVVWILTHSNSHQHDMKMANSFKHSEIRTANYFTVVQSSSVRQRLLEDIRLGLCKILSLQCRQPQPIFIIDSVEVTVFATPSLGKSIFSFGRILNSF